MTARPEPLLTRAAVVTIIGTLAGLLVHFAGGHVSAWLDTNKDWIAGAVVAVGPILTGLLTRPHVTANSDPVAKDGTPLIPAGSAAAVPDAGLDAALAEADAIYPQP